MYIPTTTLMASPAGAGFGILNARDYGAVGNGIADDTTEIQAALDAAGTASGIIQGNIVWLSRGTYLVSDSLNINKSYVRLMGPNDNAVKIKAAPTFPTDGRAVINLGPVAGPNDMFGSTVENLRIECSSLTNVVGIKVDRGNEKSCVSRVEIRQCVADDAIFVTDSRFCYLEHIGCSGAVNGIYLDANIGTIYLRDLSLGTNAGGASTSALRIDSGIVTVRDFYVENAEHGINFMGGYGGVVVGARGHSSVSGAVINIDGAMNERPFYAGVVIGGAGYSVIDNLYGRKYTADLILMEAPDPPTFVQLPYSIGSASDVASSTTVVMTVTKAVAAGDFVFVGANWGGTSNTPVSVTDTGGNTYQFDNSIVPSGSPGNIPGDALVATSKLATALEVGDEITLTVTNNTSSKVIVAMATSGLAVASWLDKTAFTNTGSTNPVSSGNTATTAQASELLVGLIAKQNDSGHTVDAPWQQVVQKTVGSRHILLAFQLVEATGAYAITGTMTVPTNYVAAIATYKNI